MRLRTFQASDGDCLLLSSRDGHHMLIDGGRGTTFTKHAAASVSDCGTLDVLCVSHIDADHISGVLELLDQEVAWRVHLAEAADQPTGRAPAPRPSFPQPPTILDVWHNGFGAQLDETANDVRNMLSLAAASQLSLARPDEIPRQLYLADLALGEKQGITLTHRIGPDQLGIPLNNHFGGQLILADRRNARFDLGAAKLTVIGPFQEDVEALRVQWRKWLEDNADVVEELQDEMDRDADRLRLNERDVFVRAMRVISAASSQLGDRESVTVPNLASIMILAEEADRTVLLTGDGAGQDIIKGLRKKRRLDRQGRIHVEVLKVQHHGAGANINADCAKAVIADHYVFCGNGSHHNPELDVIQLIADSRMGAAEALSGHPLAGRPFTMHFNNTSGTAGTPARKSHMRKVEALAQSLSASSSGRMTAHFHAADFFDINL